MKNITTFLILSLFLSLSSSLFAQVLFSDDFESGSANADWGTYYAGEDGLQAIAMNEAPITLPSGDDYVSWLQDVDGSYSGSAVAINGSTSLANYSIEADVYCYVNHSEGSAYTGLVVYADTANGDFYKLRTDFDASDRINFSGRKSDPNTYMPLFSKDFKGADNPGLFPTTDGWHKMKIEVRATSDNETSFWCYFDGTLLAGCPITDTTSTRVTSGSFGLYTFQMGGNSDGIPGYFDNVVVEQFPSAILAEDFESGSANADWGTYYAGEDGLQAIAMSEAPITLPSGDDYVSWLQDVDGSYSGSAVAINGSTSLANYSIEADVYCYVNHSEGSAYTGLVVYADTANGDFYKLRADFDASDRINFSGRKSDPNTYMPLFSKDFKGTDNPGLFPTTDGWHKMKIEVRATSDNETSFWCYFDGTLLAGCPITDTTSTRVTSGSFGLYTFQMGGNSDGIPGYFDNMVVKKIDPVTSVKENKNISNSLPEGYALEQNYPNPFNPSTVINFSIPESGLVTLKVFNVLGQEVAELVNDVKSAGSYSASFDATELTTGIYIYTIHVDNYMATKKMLLIK